jgi:outer membrane protein insertion porin family
VRRVLIALALIGGFAGNLYADEIKEIVVEGNTKTTTDTVELIAHIETGDDWQTEMVDVVKTRLVSSGLFSDVEVFFEPMQGGVRVHLIVKDKHSWVIAPAFYNQPTNTGGGIGFGENNLFGLNQKLLLYAQIATGDSFFVGAWQIPALFGSHFYVDFDTYDTHSRVIEYAPPTKYLQNPVALRRSYLNYLNAGIRLGVEPWRGVRLDTRLRGAHVAYSHVELDGSDNPDVTLDQVTSDPTATKPPKPGKEGWDVSEEFSLTLDRRANWYGVQSGHLYHVSYEQAMPALGSDFHYWEINASFVEAKQILERHNLVLKGHFEYGHHMPFQQEFTMGGTTMRGWINNQFRGDFRVLGNLEYSLPMFTIEGLSFRGLAFWDSGYTTFLSTDNPERNYLPNSGTKGLAPFKNSVGVGTRLFLRQIVLPLLGLDLGYGLEARDFQVYLAIGLTD